MRDPGNEVAINVTLRVTSTQHCLWVGDDEFCEHFQSEGSWFSKVRNTILN